METNNDIQNKINETLNALDSIEKVNVSHFFKDKVMQRFYAKKEEKQQTIWSWFTPQLQFATLVCVVVLNVFVLTQMDLNTINNIDQFAQTYNLFKAEEMLTFN